MTALTESEENHFEERKRGCMNKNYTEEEISVMNTNLPSVIILNGSTG